MASRSVWKGHIRFSLVTVPVKAYAGSVSGSAIALNQLHNECHSRIQYKKVCPVHGEVPADSIVSGYQFAEGQYVVVDDSELEKLRTANDKAVDIAAFVDPGAVDARYFTGRNNFLVPDGPIAYKPYALLYRAMVEEGKNAFAQVVMNGKEQIVLLRPADNLLVMSFLSYNEEVKSPGEFQSEAPKVEVTGDELKLAKNLVETLSEGSFDIAKYKNRYVENLTKLIEAKIAGKEVVAPPAAEQPQVINLMEALQKSLAEAKKGAIASAGKPPKQVAPSTAGRAVAAGSERKRKNA